MTFAEFVNFLGGRGPAVASTTSTTSDGSSVAICLFGSIGNFMGMVTEADTRAAGWTSSNAPDVFRFIESRGTEYGGESEEWMADEALKIAFYQGEEQSDDKVLDYPWRRGFTYGHVGKAAEWMVEVYLDVIAPEPSYFDFGRFDRVVVGAPLWIRTPSPQAWVPYSRQALGELEAALDPSERRTRPFDDYSDDFLDSFPAQS